jgi:hypothetical protein
LITDSPLRSTNVQYALDSLRFADHPLGIRFAPLSFQKGRVLPEIPVIGQSKLSVGHQGDVGDLDLVSGATITFPVDKRNETL